MKKITDISMNETFEKTFEITDSLHQAFIKLSGDDSPIHTDLEFCRKNGYDRLVGHAFLITTLLSQVYGKHFPGGSELCLSQSTNFKKPFFVGDTLKFIVKVTGINESLELLDTSVTVLNQNQTKIFQGEGILKLSLRAS